MTGPPFAPEGVMPVLRVTDMDASLRFYTGLLGFRLDWRNANDGGGENGLLSWGAATLMLSTGSHLGGPPSMTGTLYFNGRGVAVLYERLQGQVTLVWPLTEMDYGTREFGLRDPDGYVLAFAEDLGPGGRCR